MLWLVIYLTPLWALIHLSYLFACFRSLVSPASSIQPTGKPYHVYCRLLGFSCRPTSGKRSCQSSLGWETETIEFIFAGIKMFWARLRLVLARAVRRGLKWILRRTENIFIPENINCITIIFLLGVHWENKTWKKKWQQTSLKNISFTNAVRKRQQTQKWLLDFDRLFASPGPKCSFWK